MAFGKHNVRNALRYRKTHTRTRILPTHITFAIAGLLTAKQQPRHSLPRSPIAVTSLSGTRERAENFELCLSISFSCFFFLIRISVYMCVQRCCPHPQENKSKGNPRTEKMRMPSCQVDMMGGGVVVCACVCDLFDTQRIGLMGTYEYIRVHVFFFCGREGEGGFIPRRCLI